MKERKGKERKRTINPMVFSFEEIRAFHSSASR